MNDLPKEVDLIVLGTGFQESVIAAAASRVGKVVLHIDENEFYGGFWSSFNFENFMSHLERNSNATIKIRNAQEKWIDFDGEINGWNKEKILEKGRRFNIDLVPKLNYCNGKLVELLISSNICRYAEFRAVDKVLTLTPNAKLDIVPASRADIFNKKNVSIIEKRLLMKFITQCVEEEKREEDFKAFPEEGKFLDLMRQQRLTENLIHYVLFSMCMGSHEMTFKDGLDRIKTYLTSIGRYGNTPFLFPMFGCGEIPQCFCRLCAVFGGIYWLGQSLNDIQTVNSDDSEEKLVKVKFGNEEITTKKLVCGLGCKIAEDQPHEYISRAVLISSSPVGGSAINNELDGGGVVLLYHPIEGKVDGVTMIQLSHFTSCIEKGLYLTHLSTTCKEGAQKDFQQFIETFFRHDFDSQCENDSKPTIIYSAFFELPGSIRGHDYVTNQDGPIYKCCGPFMELDYDESIRQSRLLYAKMYPDDEFLPKAPEPEEIIIGDEDGSDGNVNLGVLADLIEEKLTTESKEELIVTEQILEASEKEKNS